MNQKSQFAKAFTVLVAMALFATGCTKKRDASLPDEQQESIFAISDFGELNPENSPLKVDTEERPTALSLGESAKATAEKGLVTVTSADVPERLKFMFKGFEMTGQAGHSYPVTLSVDKQFVTAYKIVNNISELSILEKQLAQVKDEVVLQKHLQNTKEKAKVKSLLARLKEIRSQKAATLAKKTATVLVPLFKFKIAKYGVLERTKNEVKEETSTLRLKTVDWSEATHVEISVNPSDRLPVGIDPAARGDLDRTFVMDKINNKILSAGTLKEEFQIPLNTQDDAKVLTLLDVNDLHVFEIAQSDKVELTQQQLQDLKQGTSSTIQKCSEEVKKALAADQRDKCILILRYDVPVKFVRPELPVVDYDGNQDSKITFKEVRAGENVGLVQIEKNVQPKKVEPDNLIDPRTMIRISDIKGKEFFFKRTLEDAPVTTSFPPGMAGALTIVKFELDEERLVVRKADKLVEFGTGSNDMDYEDIISIPVRYLKREIKDASGANYSITRLIPASHLDAEFVELDWRRNTISPQLSPYETLEKQCFTSLTESAISDVDMRFEEGVLSFSYNYTAGLNFDCAAVYPVADDYNGIFPIQTTARMKERVSFKLNDGSTDVSFIEKVPFRAQNELGYGVWTIGKLNPTAEGLTGHQGQEISLPVVQDFRNGKVLMYTVTGLEPSVNLDPQIRQLYKDTVRDVVKAWDLAYRNVFKGTAFERSGRYVDLQFSGENGIEAKVGDIDKNIVHFENKFNDNHGILGVSQVGFNPRSGIVVADSLIIYAGNLQQFVAESMRNLKLSQAWADKKKEFKKTAEAKLTANQKQEEALEKAAQSGSSKASADDKARLAVHFAKQLVNIAHGEKSNLTSFVNAKNPSNAAIDVVNAVKQMKTLGAGKYNGAIPNIEGAWLSRVLRQMSENPNLDSVELEGIIAKEMLSTKDGKISVLTKARLERMVRLGQMRSKLNMQLKNRPGCMLSARDSIARDFAAKSYKDALREELFFDIGHEMGHSQGLTHNFIGSFDKANFANEDGTETKRVYSSIMDYIRPGGFRWDGIGTYDIHALRASHLGLLEVQAGFKPESKGLTKEEIIDGKYISVKTIKDRFANGGWNVFSKHAVAGILKPYKYCTDIHVGPTAPTCQRFDSGTTAEEIVDNMIQDFEDDYVVNYHSWDRNTFGLETSSRALARSINTMFQMRQFMDEMFYAWLTRESQEVVSDYVEAAAKAYIFYNQIIRTPDTNANFLSEDRFIAVPYKYLEIVNGQVTGKEISAVGVVESRAPLNLTAREDHIDTVGFEQNKVIALNLLTMKGFPSYRYYSQSFLFSFLDFEKYVLGMTPETSIFANTVTEIMFDKLTPALIGETGMLHMFKDPKAEASVTSLVRVYAGISAILNLEASTLTEKDNFANLFKVGSSLGQAPDDRVALSPLGVSETSKTRISYWAFDNALVSNGILKAAAAKNFFIRHAEEIAPLLENLVTAQFNGLQAANPETEEVSKAKAALLEKLNALNANGDIISAETMKANPQALTVEKQVELLMRLNKQVITGAVAAVLSPKGASAASKQIKEVADQLAETLPLAALDQKALLSGLEKAGAAAGKTKETEKLLKLGQAAEDIVDGSQLETSYGMIMKNIEFLNTLTHLTNPEYNR